MRRGFISRLPSVITYWFSYSLIGLCCVWIWLHWTGKWFVTSGSLLLCSIFLSLTCGSAQILLLVHTQTHTQSDKHKFTKKHFRMSTYTHAHTAARHHKHIIAHPALYWSSNLSNDSWIVYTLTHTHCVSLLISPSSINNDTRDCLHFSKSILQCNRNLKMVIKLCSTTHIRPLKFLDFAGVVSCECGVPQGRHTAGSLIDSEEQLWCGLSQWPKQHTH